MAYIDGQDPRSFDFKNILYDKSGRRARVTINRPEVLNCVDLATLRELQLAFQDASWDEAVAVLVLTGAGERAFCTGADLREQRAHYVDAPQDYWKWMGEFCRAHELLRNMGPEPLSNGFSGPVLAERLDGKPIPNKFAGPDVKDGVAKIGKQRLYRLVDLPKVERHTLTLLPEPGISGYAFTFG